MISAREEMGLTQKQLSELSGVSINSVQNIEKLNYKGKQSLFDAVKLAEYLNLDIEKIIPEELKGRDLSFNHTIKAEMSPSQLLEASKRQIAIETEKRGLLPSPDESLETEELLGIIEKELNAFNDEEKYVFEVRHGINGKKKKTLEELGGEFNVSNQTIRTRLIGIEEKLLLNIRNKYPELEAEENIWKYKERLSQ